MTRERVREELRKLAVHASSEFACFTNVLVAVEKAFELGERLGRENSDSVYWPALCEQWRIEFGKELGREGGHIMNIVDSVRELVREEREECARLVEHSFDTTDYRFMMARLAEAIRARGVAQEERHKGE